MANNMTKRHGKLNDRLSDMVSDLWELLDEYRDILSDYNNYMEDAILDMESEDINPYEDEDFTSALADGEQLSDGIENLADAIQSLNYMAEELTEPCLSYAN